MSEAADDTDEDPTREKGPIRRCVITRERRPKEEMIRFVLDPEGRVVEDLAERLPGRGVYVSPEREQVAAFLGRIDRLGIPWPVKPVKPPVEETLLRIGVGLTRRLGESIGLTKRAGELRIGFLALEELLESETAPLILMALDTARNTREKVSRLLHGKGEVASPLEALDVESLGKVLGRRCIAVLSVADGGMARRLRIDGMKWRAFLGPFANDGPGQRHDEWRRSFE